MSRSLKDLVHDAACGGDAEQLRRLVEEDPKTIRHLVGLSYHTNAVVRDEAAKAIGHASKFHPEMVRRVVNRLVRAMSDEGATNAVSAPPVLLAIADQAPEILLPLVPELTRLAGDGGLHRGLARTLRMVADRCPGQVGCKLSQSLTQRAKRATKIGARNG